MTPDARILDRNLEALLKLAWRPVLPRPEFAAQLERKFVARAVGFSSRSASPVWIWIAAAASILLLVGPAALAL